MYAKKLALETLVVVVVFTGITMTLHAVFEMGILKNGEPKTHEEYMQRLAALAAASALVAHLGFEALGFNKQYCLHGAACRK